MAIDLHVPEKCELRAENALQASSCSPQFTASQPCFNWFEMGALQRVRFHYLYRTCMHLMQVMHKLPGGSSQSEALSVL